MTDYLTMIFNSSFFPHILSFFIFFLYIILVKVCYRVLSKIQLRLLTAIRRDREKSLKTFKMGSINSLTEICISICPLYF